MASILILMCAITAKALEQISVNDPDWIQARVAGSNMAFQFRLTVGVKKGKKKTLSPVVLGSTRVWGDSRASMIDSWQDNAGSVFWKLVS